MFRYVQDKQELHMKEYPLIGNKAREGVSQSEYSLSECAAAVEEAEKYIQLHYAEEITRDLVAEAVHVSGSYFSVMFRRLTGESFQSYLTGIRISRGKELLRNGFSVADTAREVGYINRNCFSINFKKHTGYSPTDYKCLFCNEATRTNVGTIDNSI